MYLVVIELDSGELADITLTFDEVVELKNKLGDLILSEVQDAVQH